MILDGRVPTPVETTDPTWYLVLDLVGTWIGAFGSAAAAIAAVVLGLKAFSDQRELRAERERAQADHVTLMRMPAQGGPLLGLRNGSNLPVTRVRVVCERSYESELEEEDEVLDPGAVAQHDLTGADDGYSLAVAEFDDAAGRTWIRTIDGRLFSITRRWAESGLVLQIGADGEGRTKVVNIAIRRSPGSAPVTLDPEDPGSPRTSEGLTWRDAVKRWTPRRLWRRFGKRQ